MKKGYELLNDPFLNKGTAFPWKKELNSALSASAADGTNHRSTGPAGVRQFPGEANVSEKRHYLMNIFSRNRTLFYYVFKQHIAEFMPIIYDPGIAESIREYSQFFITPQNAAYLSVEHPEQIEESLKNTAMGRDIELIVVTDAEAILGIGDWGTNGVGISTGKLMVYTGAAGIDPAKVLPVVIDAGTNRQSLLDDPLYFGLRHKRVDDDTYYAFVDKFVKQVESMFPRLYLHFEDFGRGHAAVLLKKYVDTYPSSTTTSKERASSPWPASSAPWPLPAKNWPTSATCALVPARQAAALPNEFIRKCSIRPVRRRRQEPLLPRRQTGPLIRRHDRSHAGTKTLRQKALGI